MHHLGVPDPLRDHLHGRENVGYFLSFAQPFAHIVVARMARGACDDQVSRAGESVHRLRLAAIGDYETFHLRKPPRDKGGTRIISKPHAVRTTHGYGYDILHGAPDFHANRVG